jgi:hypothetical protein
MKSINYWASTIWEFFYDLAPDVGKFVLYCSAAVLLVGLVARLFFENAKKEPEKNKTGPKQPLESRSPAVR